MRQLETLLKLQDLDLALERFSPQQQAQELAQQRAALLDNLDAALLARYNKLRRAGLGRALAQVEANACACCLAVITPSELQQIYRSEQPQTCSNCGRILYISL